MRFSQIYKFGATAAAMAAMALSGCLRDDSSRRNDRPSEPIAFEMSVVESEPIRTRLDSSYISTVYDIDFVIELNTNEDKAPNDLIQETGIYTVPSGYEGRLTAKMDQTPLNWKNLTEEHTFYSWTKSWLPTKDKDGIPTVYPEYPTGNDPIDPQYGGTDSKGKYYWVTFYDSAEDEKERDDSTGGGDDGDEEEEEEEMVPGFNLYHNNDYLEKFIGAKAGPYSYAEHGRYVMLTFKHLVSKIRIDRMALIKPDGTIDYSVRGDMTFIGLPKRAKFYPHPENGDWPYVEHDKTDPDYGGEKGDNYDVTYFYENKAGEEYYFYICPEVDFRNIAFKIKLNNEEYGREGNYYGDFKEVQFERVAGTDYDKGGDDTVLHAGEEMTLSIQLIPGVGPGIALIIKDWNTEKPDDAVHHTQPGLYTDGEVKEFLDIFLNQTSYDRDEIEEALKRFLEMYGEMGEDGKMHFPLFDNVTVDSNIFPIYRDCIIDGRGHTITMKSNGSLGSYTNGIPNPRFNIGPVRDVWITDGEHTIYIDKEGWVYYYDENGELKRGQQLTDLGKHSNGHDEKSYDISSVNGAVYKSDYYTNTISQ